MAMKNSGKILILIFLFAGLVSCQNSIPTVVNLGSLPKLSSPANSKNFSQLSAASQKEVLASGYKGTLRISQPLGRLQATTSDGHKLQGTVTLQQ
ncbi:MAG TPA: hypothetical protein VIG33_04045 [Pseudobdellovibrionaceae bacterium]|jgi:hypothetical protein